MIKIFLVAFALLNIGLNAKYITKSQIDIDKKSLQVSSCVTKTCIEITQSAIESYDFITIIENGYYVTYIVNIEASKEDDIVSRFKDKFPDMILRKRYVENKKLYSIKALDKDFYKHKDFKTKVQTKKLNIYALPTYKSKIIDTKSKGQDVNLDGCNIYEWCKQKDKKSYLPLYRVKLIEKQDNSLEKQYEQKIDVKSFIGKYKLALEFYKNKNYEKALGILKELFEQKPDDKNINFYIGRCSFELKKYDEALLAFERVFFEEESSRVKLEIARSMFMMEDYEEAKALFLQLQNDTTLPENTQKVIEFYLDMIDKKISKHFINGILMAGVNYDSNINSRSKHDTFNNVYFSSYDLYLDLDNSTADDGAFYNQEVALINYYYKISDTINNKHDVMIYNKDSFASSYNTTDVTMFTYTPALSIQHNEKLSIDYALYADTMWYGNQKYLNTIALYPKITYMYDQNNLIKGYLKYQSKFYQQDAYKTKDSIYIELGYSLTHIYSPILNFTPSIVIQDEEKKSGSLEGVDYSGIKLGISSNYIYTPSLSLTPTFTYNYARYEGIDSSYLVQQKDQEFKLALSATYIYTPQWIFQGTTDYTYQTSTIQSEEYNKYTFGINVIRTF